MMDIFLDTASVKEIKEILPWGVISGVTTNQKIFLREKGVEFKERVLEILELVDGPLSVELTKTSESDENLLEEAREYSSWNPRNIVIKVPMFKNGRGLKLINKLYREDIKTNATCLMTTNQVLLAAKAGATYTSIFYNRVKDSGGNPFKVVQDSRTILDRGNLESKIIVGSIRRPSDVTEALVAGGHIVTIPYRILKQMPWHWKTEETIQEFDRAWKEFILA